MFNWKCFYNMKVRSRSNQKKAFSVRTQKEGGICMISKTRRSTKKSYRKILQKNAFSKNAIRLLLSFSSVLPAHLQSTFFFSKVVKIDYAWNTTWVFFFPTVATISSKDIATILRLNVKLIYYSFSFCLLCYFTFLHHLIFLQKKQSCRLSSSSSFFEKQDFC